MVKLSAAKVFRSGRTVRTWNHENDKVDLGIDSDGLSLRFSLSSKGGGYTDVKVTIGSKDFASLAATMAKVDRGVAVRELSATVAAELTKQVELDAEMIQAARESVAGAAFKEYSDAPDDCDDIQKATWKTVKRLVEKLNEADGDESADQEAA